MKRRFPNRKFLLLAGIFLILVCVVTVYFMGQTFTIQVQADKEIKVEIEQDCIRLINDRKGEGVHYLTFASVHQGKTFVDVYQGDQAVSMFLLYVHPTGVITHETYFGTSAGSHIITFAIILFLILLLWMLISDYRRDIRADYYQHKNVRNLGLIIYLASLLLGQIPYLFRSTGLENAVRSIVSSARGFAIIAFPVAFISFLLVTISNIQLMRKEGKTWRNMLGAMLGILLCLATMFPDLLTDYLQQYSGDEDAKRELRFLKTRCSVLSGLRLTRTANRCSV